MEELFQIFSGIAENIFDALDNQNCQLESRSWANYLNQVRFQVRIHNPRKHNFKNINFGDF